MVQLFAVMIVAFLGTYPTRASVQVSTGVSNTTGGRVSPSLGLAYSGPRFGAGFSAVGVQTSLYYQSSYRLSAYVHRAMGQILGAPVRGGLGMGAIYSRRGLRDTTSLPLDERSDSFLGPAMVVQTYLGSTFFFQVHALYGISGAQAVLLSFQHVAELSLGFQF